MTSWNKIKQIEILKNEKIHAASPMKQLQHHAKLTCCPQFWIAFWSSSEGTLTLPAVIRPLIEWFISFPLRHYYLSPPLKNSFWALPRRWKREWRGFLVPHGHQCVRAGQRRGIWKLTHPVSIKCTQIATSAGFLRRLWLFCISNTSSHVWDKKMSCTHLAVKHNI